MKPLEGRKICMLVTNPVVADARVRKEAASATAAGARVHVIGMGDGPPSLGDAPFELSLVRPMAVSEHRWWPVRVCRNLLAERDFERRLEEAALDVRADLYHCNDLDTLGPGSRAARRAGACVVYDAHELSTEAGTMRPWKRVLMGRREGRYARRAKAVITVNPPIARELARRYRLEQVEVVFNGSAERVEVAAEGHEPLRVLFQGQFFEDRGLIELIHAMSTLRGACVLTLQGWGGIETRLRDLVEELGLGDIVVFAPPCDPLEVVPEAALHDVGIVNHRAWSLNQTLASPNKLFDYICAGLVVAAVDLPAIHEILEGAGCGVLFAEGDSRDLASALASLASDPVRVDRLKRRAVDASPAFTWNSQSHKLIDAYVRALEERQHA